MQTVGGMGYNLLGRHEIMLPLFAQAVVKELGYWGVGQTVILPVECGVFPVRGVPVGRN